MLLHWPDVKKKTFQISTLPNNITSSISRSKMTDVGTTAIDKQQKPSSGDCLIAVTVLWKKCNIHAPRRYIILLWETNVQKLLRKLTYLNWQHHFNTVLWEQTEQMLTWGKCLRLWDRNHNKLVNKLFCHKLYVPLQSRIFLHSDSVCYPKVLGEETFKHGCHTRVSPYLEKNFSLHWQTVLKCYVLSVCLLQFWPWNKYMVQSFFRSYHLLS
jgi:hypothetical protein